MSPGIYVSKKPSAIKSLHQVSEVSDVKQKTSVHMLGSAKSKRTYIRSGDMFRYSITNRQVHKKIERVKKDFYDWVIHHTQIVQSKISNYCLKLSLDSHSETHIIQFVLFQVSV